MCKSNETTFKLKKSFLNLISVAFFKINRLPAVGQSNSTTNNSDINGFSPFFFPAFSFRKDLSVFFISWYLIKIYIQENMISCVKVTNINEFHHF